MQCLRLCVLLILCCYIWILDCRAAATQAMKFAPAKKNRDFWWPDPSSTSIFSKKNRVFEISVPCTTLAWQRITCSFRNGWPSYFQKIKFEHIAAAWFQHIFETQSFQLPKFCPNVGNLLFIQAPSCEQLSMLVQFLYGATTLRGTSNINRDAARQWNSRQRRNFIKFHSQTPHQLQYFRKFRDFEISVPCNRLLGNV